MFQIYYIKELENVVWPCIQEENEIGLLNAEQYYCQSNLLINKYLFLSFFQTKMTFSLQ